MKLNTKGRYAVMALVDLGLHSKENKPISLSDIAERQDISLSYLEQLFAKLRRAKVVTSARGPGGGYFLTHGVDATTIADIVLVVDEPLDVTRCKNKAGNGCMKGKSQCLTHDLWSALGQQMQRYLSSVTIADVCEKRVSAHSHAVAAE